MEGEIRLVGGADESEGRLEVCLSGIWGTVSEYSPEGSAAKVVCKQLGYSDKGRQESGSTCTCTYQCIIETKACIYNVQYMEPLYCRHLKVFLMCG